MATDKNATPRENRPQQQAAATPSTSEARRPGGERQTSIETGREPATSSPLSRRPATSAVYGPAVTPFMLMRRMADDMDRMFQEFGMGTGGLGLGSLFGSAGERDPWRQSSALEQRIWAPQIETFRRDDKLVVRADLPGLDRDDVQVHIDDGVLTISGQRSDERDENRDDFYRTERSYGRFYRSIAMPDDVEPEQVEATFKNGVLEVTIPVPRQADRTARQIPIR